MFSRQIIPLVVLLIVISLVPSLEVAEAQGTTLTPSMDTLNLVRGTKGESLPIIRYTGRYTLSTSAWTHCKVSITLAGPTAGIQATPASDPECRRTSETTFEVIVPLKFLGVFTGGTFAYSPITSARVTVYNDTDTLSVLTFSAEHIMISEVVVISASLAQNPVNPGSIAYKVLPQNPVAGSNVYIVPTGDINLVLSLDRVPTVAPSFVVRAIASSTVGSVSASTRVDFAANEASRTFTLSGVSLESSIQLDVLQNDIPVYSTTLDISSAVDVSGYGKVVFSTEPPSLVWKKNVYYVYGAINVLTLKSASLKVTFSVEGAGGEVKTIQSTGRYSFEVPISRDQPLSDDRPREIRGSYIVSFEPNAGGTIAVTIPLYSSYAATSGKFLSFVFFTLFNSLLGVSLFIFVFGFFTRRSDLMGYGMLALILSSLIFGIPTVMSYAITAVVRTGIEDPIGLQDITMLNLGEKLDGALRYINEKSKHFSAVLLGAALSLVVVLGVLAGLVIGGGIAGILTGGALSIFLGQTLGAFAAQLVGLIVMLLLGSVVLSALSMVFPIFMNVIIMLLLFSALMQAVFAIITHNLSPLVNTIISLSFVIMLVFMTPLVLATLDKLYYEQTIWVGIGPVGFELPLNPFVAISIAVIEIVFLAMVMGMAFHRLMAALHGFGSYA